jgi:signal transduction histidine kinase
VKSVFPLKIVVPLLLGIVVSVAILAYAEVGYRRLESANRQMAAAVAMHAALLELLATITDAEAGERGFLLTGKPEYLAPYTASLPKVESALSRLREYLVQYGTPAQRDALGRLNNLVGRRLAELETGIALYRKDGAEAAQALLDTGIGKRMMEEVRAGADALAATQRRQLDEATNRWVSDIELARLGMQLMTAFTVVLLLVVWLLARRDAQQREEGRLSAVDANRRLEALVDERTAELSELSNYLQLVREEEKSKLARDLHDELGGILVSAKMDVASVETRIRTHDPASAEKLARAQTALDDGVRIKRRIIEELRPTLLDNLGLSAALDWQVREVCDRGCLACTIVTPPDDAAIPPQVSIALYRILQEALTNIVKYARARHVDVELALTGDSVTLIIEDDGVGIPAGAQSNLLSHGIAGMRHRVRALHGEFSIGRRPEGGTRIEVNAPLGREAAAPPEGEPADQRDREERAAAPPRSPA